MSGHRQGGYYGSGGGHYKPRGYGSGGGPGNGSSNGHGRHSNFNNRQRPFQDNRYNQQGLPGVSQAYNYNAYGPEYGHEYDYGYYNNNMQNRYEEERRREEIERRKREREREEIERKRRERGLQLEKLKKEEEKKKNIAIEKTKEIFSSRRNVKRSDNSVRKVKKEPRRVLSDSSTPVNNNTSEDISRRRNEGSNESTEEIDEDEDNGDEIDDNMDDFINDEDDNEEEEVAQVEKSYDSQQEADNFNNNDHDDDNDDDKSDNDDDDDDDDDDDEPISSLKRKSNKSASDEEGETDTDLDDDIPKPSNKSRRLHRLLRRPSDIDDDDNPKNNNTEDQRKSDENRNSNSKANKSQSTKKSIKQNRDASGRSLLQRICKKGDFETAKELIEGGANVNDADFAGVTPLHEAALKGYFEIVELLLDNGADINRQTGEYDKDTPLLDASSNLHVDVVKYLLQRGANPLLVNVQGDTALDVLADDDEFEDDDEDLQKVRELKKILGRAIKEFKKYHSDTIFEEEENKKENSQNQSTFYDLVSKEGRKEIYDRVAANDVNYVLQYFSNLDKKCPRDLLIVASKYGYGELVSILIAFNADINYADKNGWTSLMHAVGKAHRDVVKLLLENKADAKVKDRDGKNALDILKESELYDEEEAQLLKHALGTPTESRLGSSKTRKRKRPIESEDEIENAEIGSQTKQEPKLEAAEVENENKKDRKVEPKLENNKMIKRPKREPSVLDDPPKERPSTPVPTPEEIEAQLHKDIEAQKARELLEQQRLERKKLKEMEIAKTIEALEQKREAEKRAADEIELAKKKEEDAIIQRQMDEVEKAKRLELHKRETDKRELIRSYYPYHLKDAVFDGPNLKEAQKYSPLYSVKVDNETFCIDLQISLIFGTEDLYNQYPMLDGCKRLMKLNEKDAIWNLMWPVIGSYKRGSSLSNEERFKLYDSERVNFRELQLHWIPFKDVEAIMNTSVVLNSIKPLFTQDKVQLVKPTFKVVDSHSSTTKSNEVKRAFELDSNVWNPHLKLGHDVLNTLGNTQHSRPLW